MFSKSLTSMLCTVVALTAMVTEVSAQDKLDFNQKMSEAAAAAKKDLNEALTQYLEIRAQTANASIDYSLGRVYQRLGQCENAQQYFTSVLSNYNLPDMDSIFQRTLKDFEDLANCEQWQKVYLDCTIPPGAYVSIDNERISSCPSRAISLADGDHIIKLVTPDGQEVVETVKASSGKIDKRITLAPQKKEEAKTEVVEKTVEVSHNFVSKGKFNPGLYWGLITGGVAVAGIGGILGILAGNANADAVGYGKEMDAFSIFDDEKNKKYFVGKESEIKTLFTTYQERYSEAKQDKKDAEDKASLYKTIGFAVVGVGAAVAVTGAVLAIVDAVSEKKLVEIGAEGEAAPQEPPKDTKKNTKKKGKGKNVKAYVAPSFNGVSVGFGMTF